MVSLDPGGVVLSRLRKSYGRVRALRSVDPAIDFAVTVNVPVAEAQNRIIDSVDHRLRSVGYADRAHTELTEALGAD